MSAIKMHPLKYKNSLSFFKNLKRVLYAILAIASVAVVYFFVFTDISHNNIEAFDNTPSATEEIAVEEVKPIEGKWRVDKRTLVIRSGESDTVTCTLDGKAVAVEWQAENNGVAYVENELVYAVANGYTNLNAFYKDKKVMTIGVYVDRLELPPLEEPQPSRFELIDGFYTNPKAEATEKATIFFTGDLMCVYDMQKQAQKGDTFDFNAGFKYVRDILNKSDLTVGNLETTLSHTAPYKLDQIKIMGEKTMQQNCNAPATFLDAVRYGNFDAVVTAHNHSLDAGIQGIAETLEALDRYNLPNTGSWAGDGKEAGDKFMLFNINGIKIAILSYATVFSFEYLYTAEEMDRYANKFTKEKAENDIFLAREAGAEYVFVYMHWGKQNSTEVVGSQKKYAQSLADAGADFILGNHPHVINEYDILVSNDGREVPCIYSLGNFFTDMHEVEDINSDAIILQVDLEKTPDGVKLCNVGYIPCFILLDFEGIRNVTMPCNTVVEDDEITDKLITAHERIKSLFGNKINEIELHD